MVILKNGNGNDDAMDRGYMTPSNDIKLAHIITHPRNTKGSGLRTLQDAEIAVKMGYQADVITGLGDAAHLQDHQPSPSVPYRYLPGLKKYIYPHHDVRALLQLQALFRREKYQVVHTHLAKAGVIGRLAAGLAGVPYVVHSVHGPSFAPTQPSHRRLLYIALEKLAGHYTTHYIFWAHHLQKAYQDLGIGNQANMRVIYAPYNFSPFLESTNISPAERQRLRLSWGIPSDALVVGYVARMVPAKSQHFAIRACKELILRYPKITLLLVGGANWPEEKSWLQRLKSLAQELGISERVIFTGHQQKVAPFYRMFDVFLFPSLYEGISFAMLEAFISDLPVVAFDIPGSREALGEEAIYAPCYDLSELTAGLNQALETLPDYNSNSLSRIEKRKEVIKKWSYEKWSNDLQSFYKELRETICKS